MDSKIDSCFEDCHNNYFHEFIYEWKYNIQLTTIGAIEPINLTVSAKIMDSYDLNNKLKVA